MPSSLDILTTFRTMLTNYHAPRIDNSEYMRNGDYAPNRFDAQSDAVSVVFGHKTDSNPENTAGVMTMAGKG